MRIHFLTSSSRLINAAEPSYASGASSALKKSYKVPFKVPFKEVPQNQADEPTAAAVKPASSESPKGITPKTSVSPQTVNNDVIEINTDSEQEDEMPSRKTTSAKSSFSALTSFEELSDDDEQTESPEIQQADRRSRSELAFRYLDCQSNSS